MNGSNPVLCSPIKDSQAADTVTHSVAFNEKFPEQLVNPPLQRSYSRAQLSQRIFRFVSLETPSTSRNSSTAWGKSESPWG